VGLTLQPVISGLKIMGRITTFANGKSLAEVATRNSRCMK
jgi:hypothetical protein